MALIGNGLVQIEGWLAIALSPQCLIPTKICRLKLKSHIANPCKPIPYRRRDRSKELQKNRKSAQN